MEREMDVSNADKNIENEIVIGDKNVVANVKEYIKDVKLRKNSVISRSLLMSASPDFFKGLMKTDLDHWKNDNVQFLKKNFGDNCIYATLHKDEKTWHIHALIIPKFKNKKNEYILSNTRYFDGVERMRAWQDNYSNHMKQRFKCLNRGVKYSKAKNVAVKKWYGMIEKQLNEKDYTQILAKARNSDLQEIKIKAIERTLKVYKNSNDKNMRMYDKAIVEAKELIKDIDNLKANKQRYKEELSYLSQQYKVPQYLIDNIIKECEQINEKEHERG